MCIVRLSIQQIEFRIADQPLRLGVAMARPSGPLADLATPRYLECVEVRCDRNWSQTDGRYGAPLGKGSEDANYNLGIIFYNGVDVPKDSKKAVKFLNIAAEAGSAEANCSLGIMYYMGNGVPKDLKKK